MKRLLLIFLFLPLICMMGQDIPITGRVISEDLELLPQVKIITQDGDVVGETDNEGRFDILVACETEILKVNFIGMEPMKINLGKDCDTLEIVLMVEVLYDFMSIKKVNKLREKRFKKLKKIHEVAFQEGLFKTKEPCYTTRFSFYEKSR